MTKRFPLIAGVCIVLFACKKDKDNATDKNDLFHKDFTIKEPILFGSQSFQSSIGLFHLSDNSLLLCAGRGSGEPYSRGFRIVRINKAGQTQWSKSYYLPETYTYQIATTSIIDKDENIFVSGHIFGGDNSFGKPFLLKIDKNSGQVLWSKYYSFTWNLGPETFRGGSLYALKNGDILYTCTSVFGMNIFRINNSGSIIWSKRIASSTDLIFSSNIVKNGSKIFEDASSDIFITGQNAVSPNNDYLLRINASGQIIFSKVYVNEVGNSYNSRLYSLPDGNILLFGLKSVSATEIPYFIKLSKNGEIITSKLISNNGYYLEQTVNEFMVDGNKLIISMSGGVNTSVYTFNTDLTVIDKVKTLGAGTGGNFTGSMIKDIQSDYLYFVFDTPGPAGGNGFQLLKTTIKGSSCQSYNESPDLITSSPISSSSTDLSLSSETGFPFTENQLTWTSESLVIQSIEDACNK